MEKVQANELIKVRSKSEILRNKLNSSDTSVVRKTVSNFDLSQDEVNDIIIEALGLPSNSSVHITWESGHTPTLYVEVVTEDRT
jgi:hypothetical protein